MGSVGGAGVRTNRPSLPPPPQVRWGSAGRICLLTPEPTLKVGSHEGTCCRDMSRGRISCAVHTKGLVAGIGFLECSHGGSCRRDMS